MSRQKHRIRAVESDQLKVTFIILSKSTMFANLLIVVFPLDDDETNSDIPVAKRKIHPSPKK